MARSKLKEGEKFSDAEATRRVEAALRAAFNSPHRTYEESKIGKRPKDVRKKRMKARSSK